MNACLLGVPNSGKSSLLNRLVGRRIAAVSDKAGTTDDANFGLHTDYETNTQLQIYDTPGAYKATNSMRSRKLVTKAWEQIEEADHVLFVVDCVKRLSFEVRNSLILFNKLATKGFDPQNKLILDAMQDGSFDEAAFDAGAYQMTQHEQDMVGAFPSTLILNKVDLVSNKRKMKELQAELEDLNPFE